MILTHSYSISNCVEANVSIYVIWKKKMVNVWSNFGLHDTLKTGNKMAEWPQVPASPIWQFSKMARLRATILIISMQTRLMVQKLQI